MRVRVLKKICVDNMLRGKGHMVRKILKSG